MFTNPRAEFCLGFFENPNREIEPSQVLFFEGVGYVNSFPLLTWISCLQPTVHSSGSQVQVKFTPVLRGYITTDYQENAVVRGQILADRLFDEDLVNLEPVTNWRITYNKGSGVYSINPDNSSIRDWSTGIATILPVGKPFLLSLVIVTVLLCLSCLLSFIQTCWLVIWKFSVAFRRSVRERSFSTQQLVTAYWNQPITNSEPIPPVQSILPGYNNNLCCNCLVNL